jgi:hypothetical protein
LTALHSILTDWLNKLQRDLDSIAHQLCYNRRITHPKGRCEVTVVTFVIDRRKFLDGRNQFAVLRIRDSRLEVVSHHPTLDEASEAANRYASQARFAGLDAHIIQRD